MRETIIQLHNEGFKGSDICSRLNIKVSLSSVHKLIKKYKEEGSVKDRKKRAPCKVNEAVKNLIKETYENCKNR